MTAEKDRLPWRGLLQPAAKQGVPMNALISRRLCHSHCVLACRHVCKPYAYECWLVCTECWPADWHIRTECWSIQALVCKPSGLALQAVTAMATMSNHASYSCC